MNSTSLSTGMGYQIAWADTEALPGRVKEEPYKFYFNDSQVVLKASLITWFPSSLLITHSSEGRTTDI